MGPCHRVWSFMQRRSCGGCGCCRDRPMEVEHETKEGLCLSRASLDGSIAMAGRTFWRGPSTLCGHESSPPAGGRSPRDVDTYFYAAVASVADRRSNSTGQIWPRLECLLLVL